MSAMTASPPKGFLLGLSLAQLISWGSTFYLYGLLVQPLEAALHISRAQSSLGFSLMLLGEGAAALPVGRWIDRGHGRRVMCMGSVLAGLCLLAMTQVNSLASYYLLWGALGLSLAGVLYQPVFAVVTRAMPHDFRRGIIVITFLGGLASTVFIPLMQWLISSFGWRPTLVVLAGFHLLVCLPLHAWFLRGPAVGHGPRSHPPAGVAPAVGATPTGLSTDTTSGTVTGAATGATTDANAVTASRPSAPAQAQPSLSALLRSPVFLLVGAFTALSLAVSSSVPAHLVPLLREQGMPEAAVVWVPAAIGAIQVFGRVLLFRFEGRFDVHRANLWTVMLMPGSLLLLALLVWLGPHGTAIPAGQAGTLALVLAVVFTSCFGLANGLLTIVKGTAVAQYVNRTHMATLNGALGLPTALARAAMPALVGALWTREAGYGWGVGVLVLASAAACVAFWQAQRRALAASATASAPGTA